MNAVIANMLINQSAVGRSLLVMSKHPGVMVKSFVQFVKRMFVYVDHFASRYLRKIFQVGGISTFTGGVIRSSEKNWM